MGWRNRLDPTRLRVDRFRERARRLRDIQYLGQQVAQLRRTGLRSEVLVPIAALVILSAALALSALSSDTLEVLDATTTPTSSGESVEVIQSTPVLTPTAVTGYPSPSGSAAADTGAAPSAEPFYDETASPYLDETTIAEGGSGYPFSDNGPQPVDPAPDGSVPDVPPPPDLGGATIPTTDPALQQPLPTTGLLPPTPIPPAPLPPGGGSSGNNNGAYPAPTTAAPGNINPTTAVPGSASATPDVPLPGETSVGTTPAASVTAEATTPATTPTPEPTTPPPTPTARPARVISGNVRWSTANSPIVLNEDHLLAQGSTLTIDPGVEVRLGPNVRLTIAGKLQAQGSANAPIRMVGSNGRWDALVGAEGGSIALDNVQISQAGRSGTAISSVGGALSVRNSSLKDSGGGIVALGSALDLRDTYISGNAIGGPVVNVQMPTRAATAIIGNVIGGNGTPAGAPQVAVNASNAAGPLTIEGNLIIGSPGIGPGLVISTRAPLSGSIRCNGFNSGTIGLQIAARLPDTTGFNLAIENNAFSGQSTYGATSTLGFNVANNWWNDPSGPADASRNAQGRGVPVGVNLQFQPWLSARPDCAPSQ